MVLIAAIIAMSFTVVSRSGAMNGKTLHYTPEAQCYTCFMSGFATFCASQFNFVTNPTSAGCGVRCTNVKLISTGDLLCPNFNPVMPQGSPYTKKCDETLNVICCFHIVSGNITDVCSGKQVAN